VVYFEAGTAFLRDAGSTVKELVELLTDSGYTLDIGACLCAASGGLGRRKKLTPRHSHLQAKLKYKDGDYRMAWRCTLPARSTTEGSAYDDCGARMISILFLSVA
jgi:hypothetical protein